MSDWKVSKEIVLLKPHPNAEKLEIAKVGSRQLVVQKGLYQTRDVVILVPEKSILPDELAEPYKEYLQNGNRVRSVRLRKEVSEGLLIPTTLTTLDIANKVKDKAIGEDISHLLNITLYEPPIPPELMGKVKTQTLPYQNHDCEQYTIYESEIAPTESIIVTEKIHGSLISITYQLEETHLGLDIIHTEVTSKGNGKAGRVIESDPKNFYWQAVNNTKLNDLVLEAFDNPCIVQIVGEAVPIQKGFDYGFTKPNLFIYKVIVNGEVLDYYDVPKHLQSIWVPILYLGKAQDIDIRQLAKGNTIVPPSKHIMEGVVVSPIKMRQAEDGKELYLKFISEAYAKKSTGEEIN